MRRIKQILFAGCLIGVTCCGDQNTKPRESTTSGTIHISVDESFKPVIDSQVQVFESLHPNAHIIVHYKPEAECLKDLNVDSIRMVLVTRGLDRKEQDLLKEKLSFVPRFGTVAYDAIAVITNNQSKDTNLTMQDIRSLAAGTSGFKYKMLLDGTSSTSTVRFVTDSLLKGQPLSANVVAAKNTEDLINYVSVNNDAIGLLGVSWVGNKKDPEALSFLEKVTVANIESRDQNGKYIKPYQANISYGRYPMIRPIYYILKENYDGLGSGFKNFLIYEKGQLIFYHAFLLPAKMKFDIKNVNISE